MEESLKNRLILILGIMTVIFLTISIASCSDSRKQKVSRDKEILSRMNLEEKINNFTQEKQALDKKIANLNQELTAEKAAHETTEKALLQEQLVNQSLKEEVLKVTKLKEKLEEDLKEALVAAKSVQPKK
ncbi:MAG: hypothetical protein ACM3IL_03155 [Deltaproteobacteria bacterium]